MMKAGQMVDTQRATASTARPPFDLVIRGERILADGVFAPREVGVRGGRVTALGPLGQGLSGTKCLELRADEVLLPGLVDTHVHVNEPGRTEWEGFASATKAAAAGGVTTIIDMPLNSVPPTVNIEALQIKRSSARNQAHVNVGFWGGAIPGNRDQLRAMHDAGVFGFKCFLVHSGVDEFPNLDASDLEPTMEELRAFDGLLLVHAEDAATIDKAPARSGIRYVDFLESRPRAAEDEAIFEVIQAARATGARAHILHISSSSALPMIAAAKRSGVQLTVETCPHYLTLTAEEVPNGATSYKCCPPIRESDNREALWQGLLDQTIDCVVSDHSPSTTDLKMIETGDFAAAWGGISSLQLSLSVVWSQARSRGIPLERVIEWMSARPAELAGLTGKGKIAVGFDADFAVFAPDDTYTVDERRLLHKHPITPYHGMELWGTVRRTIVGGKTVDYEHPVGTLIERGRP